MISMCNIIILYNLFINLFIANLIMLLSNKLIIIHSILSWK